MNNFSLWKYILVLGVFLFGIIYALPNLSPPDPAVQVSLQSAGDSFDSRLIQSVKNIARNEGILDENIEVNQKSLLIRTDSYEEQIKLKDELRRELGPDYVVALNLAYSTPDWLQNLNASPLKLGLDLRGGIYFLLEVDTDSLIETRLEANAEDFKRRLREESLNFRSIESDKESVTFLFATDEDKSDSLSFLRGFLTDFEIIEEFESFKIKFSREGITSIQDYAVQQNLTTLRNRVNELGVSEPVVQREGAKRISVQLPGIQDTAEAKKIIGKTANLEFRLEANNRTLRSRKEPFDFRGVSVDLEKNIIISGDKVADANVGYDESGFPQVNITLDGEGGAKMHRSTRNNVGRKMAVLFIERKSAAKEVVLPDGTLDLIIEPVITKRVISLATIQSALPNRFRITGLDSPNEASELALLLRAGALAAPMEFVEESTVGPSLGAENIRLGIQSLILGLFLVLIFMVVYYKIFGLFANIAVIFNLILITAIMSILSATLTLPGIAGIVLTVGMAVDANVLIFSRIREELKNNSRATDAIIAGYDRAFVTILDANITTLIVAVILYAIGTGPIKGFAITLSIGIVTSMFTSILGTRAMVSLIYRKNNVRRLWI
ncbi:protein translocase subunit SecD [SAR86 cluster bacterium]|nr:protein translocase subunit SecD [SAR86 cluster bacterium]